jgi:pimeloyl-ACP methyl ester carboxylesterase
MAMTKDDALTTTMGSVPSGLISAGYRLLALDLPCHGTDTDINLPPLTSLRCWRNRIEAGDQQLFVRYCNGLSAVLDELDVEDVYVVGQSRGGYVAAICAARDPRIRKLMMIAPVTNLQRLSEFDGYVVDQSVFGLQQHADALRTIAIRVRIGRDDQRVGTEAAIEFAGWAGASLDIVDMAGHVPPDDGSTVTWLGE